MNENNQKIKELVTHLKRANFAKNLVNYINKEIPLTIFPIAKREGISINEWVSTVEDDTKQHTVLTTTRLSYDGVKTYLVYNLNKDLENYKGAKIKILKLNEVVDKETIDGKSFDAIFDFNGEIIIIEIKVTQKDDGFTGATHSTSKADTYLLISLSINRDSKVEEDVNFVNGAFIMLINLDKSTWKGEASSNSSFTKFTFSSDVDYSDYIILGKLKKNRVHKKIIFEKI
jgi:hypothetical protein